MGCYGTKGTLSWVGGVSRGTLTKNRKKEHHCATDLGILSISHKFASWLSTAPLRQPCPSPFATLLHRPWGLPDPNLGSGNQFVLSIPCLHLNAGVVCFSSETPAFKSTVAKVKQRNPVRGCAPTRQPPNEHYHEVFPFEPPQKRFPYTDAPT